MQASFAALSNAVSLTHAAYNPGPSCQPTDRDYCGQPVSREGGSPLNLTALYAKLFAPCLKGFVRSDGLCIPSCPSGKAAQSPWPRTATASSDWPYGSMPQLSGKWTASANPPGWIQLDFAAAGKGVMLSVIEAVVNMSPIGFANHSVFVDGALITTWAGNMTKGEVLTWRAGSPIGR